MADDVVRWPGFAEAAEEAFKDAFDLPPPDPATIAREEREKRTAYEIGSSIVEFLAAQSEPVRRNALIEHAKAYIQNVYGPTRAVYRDSAIRRAVNTLVDDGRMRRENGWYSLIGTGPDMCAVKPGWRPPAVSEQTESTQLVTPEDTIGEGDELLYVYFNEAERKLATREGRDWWPCKVGFTAGRLTERVLQQRPVTSMSRLPTVGLVIKTNDGRRLERAVHVALEEVKARVDDALGNESFETSPRKIKDWYLAQQQTIAALRL